MKAGEKIVLGIIGFLLTVSIIIAQTLFQLERTVLSYSYMSAQLERVAVPLEDPAIHADAAAGAIGYVQDQLSLDLSGRLTPYVREAAIQGFDADWFLRTGKRMLFNSQRFLNGDETVLSLPLSFDGFKLSLLDIAGAKLGASQYIEIDREVSQIASSIDLGLLLPEIDQLRILRNLKYRRVAFIILTYVVPIFLTLLCFVTRRLGSGLKVSGFGLLAGGGFMAVSSLSLRNLVSQESSSAIEEVLPQFLRWTAIGAEGFVREAISGFLPVGIAISGFGLVMAVCGTFLIRGRDNRQIKTSQPH